MAGSLPQQSFSDYLEAGYQLIVTTPADIHSWSLSGRQAIFHSDSSSILGARRIVNHGNLVAVSDKQGILLYDLDTATTNSYNLKGAKGRVRTTHYDEPSRRLFFTTKLQDAVQCFSVESRQLLRSAEIHPSPPLTFAFSQSLDAVLSASINPPVTILTSMTGKVQPYLLRTDRSDSAVAAAAFQDGPGTLFTLVFFDGTLAVYEVYNSRWLQGSPKGVTKFRVREVGYIKRLHSISSSSAAKIQDDSRSGSSAKSDPKRTGNFSLAFVPGNPRNIVSAGPDGKFCVVMVEPSTTIGNQVLVSGSWEVGAPATSLSILHSDVHYDVGSRGMNGSTSQSVLAPLISIGRVDGHISFFDLNGRPQSVSQVDNPCPVIGLEWIAPRQGCKLSIPPKPEASNDKQTRSPTKSVYYTPSKDLLRSNHKSKGPESAMRRKTGLRRPTIPVRTRSRHSHSSTFIPHPPTRLIQSLENRDTNATPPASARSRVRKPRRSAATYRSKARPAKDGEIRQSSTSLSDSISDFKLDHVATNSDSHSEIIESGMQTPTRNSKERHQLPTLPRGPLSSRDTDNTVIPWRGAHDQTVPPSKQHPMQQGSQEKQTELREHKTNISRDSNSRGAFRRTPDFELRRRGMDLSRRRPFHWSNPWKSTHVPLDGTYNAQPIVPPSTDQSSISSPYSHDLSPLEHVASKTVIPPPVPQEPTRVPPSPPQLTPIRADIDSVRALVLAEMALLRDELGTQFRTQREWFESFVRERRRLRRTLGDREKVMQLEVWKMKEKNENRDSKINAEKNKGKGKA